MAVQVTLDARVKHEHDELGVLMVQRPQLKALAPCGRGKGEGLI